MNPKALFPILLAILLATMVNAQERFSTEVLSNPKKYGKTVEASFPIEEISNFQLDTVNRVNLRNGLRSSSYLEPQLWKKLQEEVEVVSISVVFSKYPIRKDGYSMNHKLLFNRLNNLFEIDPELNDEAIDWKIVLHTNCKTDEQVDSLFHGIVIEYEREPAALDSAALAAMSGPINDSTANALEATKTWIDLPNDLTVNMQNANADEKRQILIEYLEEVLEDTAVATVTPEYLRTQEERIRQFIERYSRAKNDLVYKVFDRNRQWKEALVVADWTGSMYQHGAQALLWHALNFETSGLRYFTLFNDGDWKGTRAKKIGKTGGIYFEDADHIDRVLKLYELVMLKGGGGDGPENDLEAIIKGIEKYPEHSEVILIADNNACVRDIELLSEIDRPIRVVVCGYKRLVGMNPQYIQLARETGGSLHTVEHDIYEMQVELNRRGKAKSLVGYDYNIREMRCAGKRSIYPDSYYKNRIYRDLDSAKADRAKARILDLSNQALEKVPGKVRKLKQLNTLSLSNNKLMEVRNSVGRLYMLETVDLSYNKLTQFPDPVGRLKGLKRLDLSFNQMDSLTYLPKLDRLIHLDLSGNELEYLPRDLKLKSLEFLYVKDNHLKELPVAVARLRKLRELQLSGNELTVIPKRISRLRRLEILDLSDNELQTLPGSITNLKQLQTLNLSGNHFSEEYIAYLQKLMPNTVIQNQ